MRKLLSLAIAVLFVGTLGACQDRPTEIPVEAQANANEGTPPAERGLPPLNRALTWGNTSLWEFIAPPNDILSTAEGAHAPFYVIAPVDPNNPHSPGFFFGDHDHTIPVPPGNHGTYSAIWHIELVRPGPNGDDTGSDANIATRTASERGCSLPSIDPCPAAFAGELVYAADVEGDDDLEPLTSAARVEKAESMGLVEFEDQPGGIDPIVFKCPVHPLNG